MERINGWVENGNITVNIAGTGYTSSNKVQGSFPLGTVTVYAAGTLNLAAIYADNSGTFKANPFTAAQSGQWFFYAAPGRYDIKFSGGGIAVPFTLGDFYLNDMPLGFYNVLDYGAKGDGTTDDRDALNTLANTTIPSGGGTMYFPAVHTYLISSDVTFPANVSVMFDHGAMLSIASGKVVSIYGPIVASPVQIFSGLGTVSFTTGSASPNNYSQSTFWVEWWGAKGDVSTDDTLTLQAAFNALPNGCTMRFASRRNYYVTTEIVLDHKFQATLLGDDGGIGYANPWTKPAITYAGHSTGVTSTLKMNNCYACTVQGLIIESNDALDVTKGTLRGILVTYVAGGNPALSSRNKIINCSIYAYNTIAAWIGIDVSNAGGNNEHHDFTENLIFGGNNGIVQNSQIGINLDQSQAKAIVINRSNIANVGTAVAVQGSFRATNNSFTSVYTCWSLGFLTDPAYVLGDDIEDVHNYISTNQHPGGAGATFIGNRVANMAATGDTVDDYWVKTVGKFTFIDCSWINDSLYNTRGPGPFTFQGDGLSSSVYFENCTIQADQFPLLGQPYGLETMNATVVDGARTFRFGGNQFDEGTYTRQTVPADYIARKTINTAGAGQGIFAGLFIGDNDISIDGLYQEYGLSVTVVGTTGATIRRFAVVGVDSLGRRSLTSLGAATDGELFIGVANANATLSGSNYLALKWPSQPARPPVSWSVYEVNSANSFQWRLVVNQADVPAVFFQVYNVVANPAGGFVSRPLVNEASDVGVNGRLVQINKQTFTDADTTPSVAIGNRFVASNTGATSISDFDDGKEGQLIYILCTNGNTTFVHGTIKMRGAGNVTAAANTLYTFGRFANVWYQQG